MEGTVRFRCPEPTCVWEILVPEDQSGEAALVWADHQVATGHALYFPAEMLRAAVEVKEKPLPACSICRQVHGEEIQHEVE